MGAKIVPQVGRNTRAFGCATITNSSLYKNANIANFILAVPLEMN